MNKTIEKTKEGVDHLIDRARDTVVGVSARAERGVESAAGRAVETVHATGKHVRLQAKKASRDAHRRVGEAAKSLEHGYARTRADLSRMTTATSDYVTGNPGRAVLIAASAGFLLGFLVRGQRSSA